MNAADDGGRRRWRARLGPLYALAVALQFFTRLPMPRDLDPTPEDLARASPWLPVVGGLVGGLLALVALSLAATPLVPGARVVPLLLVGVLLTGAFHEDGLADAADGLFGGWTREDKLRIMRDSRIGSYGALAVVLLLGGRAGALLGSGPGAWPVMLVVAHVLGRWSTLPLLVSLPYARAEGAGPGKPLVEGTGAIQVVLGSTIALMIAFAVGGNTGLAAMGIALALTFTAARFLRQQLGGITGDALGAVNVVVELATLTVFAAAHPATHSPFVG
ncbi:MAG: adenosylcobinamide-GDP ribazoletransferase [Myxococcota bacterium]